jgi:hypothetical protein
MKFGADYSSIAFILNYCFEFGKLMLLCKIVLILSKKIGFDKNMLLSPSVCVEIVIKDDFINVKVIFENNEENQSLHLNTMGESFIHYVVTGFALLNTNVYLFFYPKYNHDFQD